MSDHSLPKTVDPLKYADQNKALQGVMEVQNLPRLADMLASDAGTITVDLEFDRDEQRIRILRGRLSTSLSRICERCLEPVQQPIETEFTLGIVLTDEQASQLPGRYEPLLVDPESLELKEVIEEELILSLPMFAYHDRCHGEYEQESEDSENKPEDGAQGKENPFSVLAGLKGKK